jgi:hypothetical protein
MSVCYPLRILMMVLPIERIKEFSILGRVSRLGQAMSQTAANIVSLFFSMQDPEAEAEYRIAVLLF